jgi:hypothetical protein
MLPPHLRTIIKQIDQAVDKAESGADDRSRRADKAQQEVVVAIQGLANELKAYQAKQGDAEQAKNRRENLTISSLIVTAIVTVALAIIGGLQWHTLEKTDRTLRNTLVANNRAWIWAEITVASDLTYEPNGDAKITLAYKLMNGGSAPALNVHVDPKLSPMLLGRTGKPPSDALRNLRQECRSAASSRVEIIPYGFQFGEAVFPQRSASARATLTVPSAEITEALARSSDRVWIPQLRFCVTYGFAVDDKLHETGLVYDLLRTDSGTIKGTEAVPQNLLHLEQYFFGSSYAN